LSLLPSKISLKSIFELTTKMYYKLHLSTESFIVFECNNKSYWFTSYIYIYMWVYCSISSMASSLL